MPEVLTVDEAAALLRCSPRTLRQWCSAKRVPCSYLGRRYLLPREQLLLFVAGQQPAAARRETQEAG
jgi:excisionase family DNA binding protein